MKQNINTDQKSELGRSVMAYLGIESRKSKEGKSALPAPKKISEHSDLFRWVRRGTSSDDTPAPSIGSIDEPKLRVSNLLSKQAAKADEATAGKDYTLGPDGVRYAKQTSLAQAVKNSHDFWKTPILRSAVYGAVPALGYWAVSKFLNPDVEGTDNKRIETIAAELLEQDEKNTGKAKGDYEYYMEQAKAKSANDRWRRAAWVWLGSSALAHSVNINPSDWASLYRFPKTRLEKKNSATDKGNSALEKQSSMLGSQMAMDYNSLQAAVALSPALSPQIKTSALNALAYSPQPVMTSTNIINNAIYSGESAKTGLPIGRIITSAAVDGGVGFGLGKLFNLGSPGRAGILAGIGSALYNALSYTNKN